MKINLDPTEIKVNRFLYFHSSDWWNCIKQKSQKNIIIRLEKSLLLYTSWIILGIKMWKALKKKGKKKKYEKPYLIWYCYWNLKAMQHWGLQFSLPKICCHVVSVFSSTSSVLFWAIVYGTPDFPGKTKNSSPLCGNCIEDIIDGILPAVGQKGILYQHKGIFVLTYLLYRSLDMCLLVVL